MGKDSDSSDESSPLSCVYLSFIMWDHRRHVATFHRHRRWIVPPPPTSPPRYFTVATLFCRHGIISPHKDGDLMAFQHPCYIAPLNLSSLQPSVISQVSVASSHLYGM